MWKLILVLGILFTSFQIAEGREHLDRGVIALPMDGIQIYVGWRLLKEDPKDIGFNVYRSEIPDSNYESPTKTRFLAKIRYLRKIHVNKNNMLRRC